ncbi:spondin domain-containing protein [Kaarinaea lacus]
MKLIPVTVLLGACVMSGVLANAHAADLDVKVTNLSHGIYFTPLLISAHDSSTHLFQAGTAASDSLKAMAECGDISVLASDLSTADNLVDPASGVLAPGSDTMGMLTTDHTHLSLVAMLLPTNDGFVGIDALEIPTTAGTYTYYLNAWDAGSEANSELMDTTGCAVGMVGIPADPTGAAGSGGSGVAGADSNTTVHIHRGVLGDSNDAGGSSDLSNTVHRWQNPIAEIEITVTP